MSWYDDYGKTFEDHVRDDMKELEGKMKKLADKMAALENIAYEKDLIQKDVVDYIKHSMPSSHINIFGYDASEMLYKAACWHAVKDKDLSEEEKKQHEAMHDYVVSIVNNTILQNDERFKLTHIIEVNYGEAYLFEYEYEGETLRIRIPNFVKANEHNYASFLHPYQVNYKESDISWGLAFAETNYRNIHDKIVEWHEKRMNPLGEVMKSMFKRGGTL